MANRRKFSSSFKVQVALEALKERDSLAELSRQFEVSQVIDDKHFAKDTGTALECPPEPKSVN